MSSEAKPPEDPAQKSSSPPLPGSPAGAAFSTPLPTPGEPVPRAICGFWQRLVALTIDWIILAIPLEIFGWIFFDKLARAGAWGALIGAAFAMAYSGFLGSSAAGGKTLGMRACRVKVVDAQGRLLSLPRSFLRYAIFWLPMALSGAALWLPLVYAIDAAVFVIAYLYLFNRRTRQSLHDLATGAFVVRDAEAGRPVPERMWRGHWAVAAGCIAAGLVAAAIFIPRVTHSRSYGEVLAVQRGIAASGWVGQVSVQVGATWTNGKTSHYMIVTVAGNGKPADDAKSATELAAIALRDDPRIMKLDDLEILIRPQFNLGIASGYLTSSFSHSPRKWKQLISSSGSQPTSKI